MQRGVWCLQKLTLVVHPGGSSQAAKTFAKTGLIEFANKHNHIKFTVVHTKDQYAHPRLIGHYADGNVQTVPLKGKNEKMILDALNTLRQRNGGPLNQRKWPLARTRTRSFQGAWAADAWSQFPLTSAVPKHVPAAAAAAATEKAQQK